MKIFNFTKRTETESPLTIATAYEQNAFEDMLKRVVKEALQEMYSKTIDEEHPSGLPFGTWAISIVHAVGGMRSEYEALQKQLNPHSKKE